MDLNHSAFRIAIPFPLSRLQARTAIVFVVWPEDEESRANTLLGSRQRPTGKRLSGRFFYLMVKHFRLYWHFFSAQDAAKILHMAAPLSSTLQPLVSVVIPCYNQGAYLNDAVDSVLAQSLQDFEIIIVDDGSDEPATVALLAEYRRPRTSVLHTINQGLAAARNTAIAAARGKYILPLDADDKIAAHYLEKATKILEGDDSIGIVYCQAEFFGARTGRWPLPEYSFPAVLLDNQIFCSALFRRADGEKVGGYKSNMIYGWEDYDLWLSLIELGRGVVRIPEVLFFYRRTAASMAIDLGQDDDRVIYSYVQLFRNHPKLYSDNVDVLFRERSRLRSELHKAERLLRIIERMGYWKLRSLWQKLRRQVGF